MALADFIPSEGQRRIADAITAAERHTTGEICVHVTPRCRGDVVKRAKKTFNRLHLYTTKRRNSPSWVTLESTMLCLRASGTVR